MTLNFYEVCLLLEGVEKIQTKAVPTSTKAKKEVETKTIEFIDKWFATHRGALDHPNAKGATFLSIVFPQRRKDRVYGFQSPLLAKKITKLLNFNHGRKFLFERWATSPSGDIGHHLEIAMRSWDGTFKNKRQFPIERIDDMLTQMASKYRFSDPAIQRKRDRDWSTDEELSYILKRIYSWEAKWLARLLLREYSTIIIDEDHFFQKFHFLLPDLLKFQNDFEAAFETLRGNLGCFPSVAPPHQDRAMRAEAAEKLKATIGIKISRPTFHKVWSFKHCLQLVGNHAWAGEVKYDGEYCEIHINLANENEIQIFSKNGKDATNDRQALRSVIENALRIGRSSCFFKRKCIVLAEMVLYSDQDKSILPFSKIRKHVTRSGSFISTAQDSAPHAWEHLMLVFFDVLMVDDQPIMRKSLKDRREILRNLVVQIPGRSERAKWSMLDFSTHDGVTDLKQAFARTLANQQEGLVLKPLYSPYLPLFVENDPHRPAYFIKLKKDYLADMGGERDLGDFAVIGARFDPQVAPKSDLRPLHWTHYYLGCLQNESEVRTHGTKPLFKVVACISLDKCIPRPELKYLNTHGPFRKFDLPKGSRSVETFDVSHGRGYEKRMTVAFKKPFVAEILGGGYEMGQNETFEMLRHPRIKKVHHDRTWEDAVIMQGLKRMAEEKWDVPDADALDGHAKDVAVLANQYYRELHPEEDSVPGLEPVESNMPNSDYDTAPETRQAPPTQRSTQYNTQRDSYRTTQRESEPSPRHLMLKGAVVPETQESQPNTAVPPTSSPVTGEGASRTQAAGVRAFREVRSIFVREDVSERIEPLVSPPSLGKIRTTDINRKRSFEDDPTSPQPPPSKRVDKGVKRPLQTSTGNGKAMGSYVCDDEERVIRVFVPRGFKVEVVPEEDEDRMRSEG